MPPVLKFLRFSSGANAEKDLEILDKAASIAKKNEINVEIIRDASEIRKLLTDKAQSGHCIYVCFPFEGQVFEKFKHNGFRIIGPQCVISCLLLEVPVPKRLYPVCNVSMLGVTACCSSMKKDERNSLHELILQMGGEVTGDFTSVVTHLIAKEVGSKKYQVAANNKVPIVSPSWVHSCWENSKYEHIIATDNSTIREHILPIFKGCTICVTGLDVPQRDLIKGIVHENGGTYSGELNMKTCTHLLVDYPQGAKYKYAKQWKLHCVSPSWLFDSMKEGHWLSEDPYKVEPEPDSTMSRPGNMTSRMEIQETMRNSTLLNASTAAENAAKSRQNFKQSKKQNTNCENDHRKLVFKEVQLGNIDVGDFTFQDDGEQYYLDGCQIYLENKPGPIMDCCRKIINNGGGMRLNSLEESITHVVLWNDPSNNVKTFLLECDGVLPHVVSPLWLIDSFKNGEVMDVKDYSVVDVIDKDMEEEREVFAKPDAVASESAFATTVNTKFEEDLGDDTALMNQYLSTNHESTRLSQVQDAGTRNDIGANANKEATALDDETASLEEEPSPFLQGMTFCIQRFSKTDETNIQNLIQEYSGAVTTSLSQCDHAIVPLIVKKGVSTHPKELTLCWLEQSIESEQLIDVKASFLFHPISIPRDATPLSGCVVTISQYAGMERQHLFHLAELLGAFVQEYFVRKESKKAGMTLKASTHLILSQPEGSKYDASVKWGIPCVAKEWLYQCAISGSRLPETRFSLDNYKGDNDTTNTTNPYPGQWATTVKASESNLPSFELSSRGPSILEHTTSRQNATLQHEDEPPKTPVENSRMDPQTPVKKALNTTRNSNSSKQENKMVNIHQISSGVVEERDFTAFNNMISQEKENTLVENNTNNNNNSTKNTTITVNSPATQFQSPKFSLDKSRFSFDFGNALEGMQSPVGCGSQDMRRKSSRKSRGSLPLDVQFSEALQRAVDKHVPEEDRVALDESFNRKNEELSKVLRGCVCVVSKKLAPQQSNLHEIVYKLGGDTKFLYDDGCTHFVHQGKANDMSKDYLMAKKGNKCYIVSPHWLEACMASRLRVPETDYPSTYNPRMSLDVVKNRSIVEKTSPISNSPPSGVQEVRKKVNQELLTTEVSDPVREEETSPEKPSMSDQQLDVQKKMEELMEATKLPRNRRLTRRQTSSSSNGTKNDSIGQPFNRRLRSRTSSQSRNSDSSNNSNSYTTKPSGADIATEQSQTHVIAYDVDATEREARERVLEQLKRASPSQDIESLDYPINKLRLPSRQESVQEEDEEEQPENENNEVDTLADIETQHYQSKMGTTNLLYDEEEEREKKKIENAEKYKFLFSGMTAADKIKYGAIIEELGGTFLDNQYFNTQCTHVVVHCPTRSEKYLAAVASGKWIMHKSYLEASREAAMFVDESEHEWGCCPDDSDFYQSGKRWRTDLAQERTQNTKSGAFKGWVVLLCIEASKQPGFKRILEAGGGKVLAIRPPFENIDGATHAFIGDKRQAAKYKLDYGMLNDAGIWILKPEFISDFLTVHPKPSACNYVLDDVSDGNIEENGESSTPIKRKASDRLVQKEKRHRK